MLKRIMLIISAGIILFSPGWLYGETSTTEETEPYTEPSTELLYAGEVISVDLETNELSVQYYDYETNVLKEITFALESSTQLENVGTLDEITIGDTVNVEYVIEENKNIARRINVEGIETEDILPSPR